MEGSILSRFQLDMGLSRQPSDADSNLDASPGHSQASSTGNERDSQHDFLGRESSSNSDPEEFPFTPAQCCAHTLSDEDQVPKHELK